MRRRIPIESPRITDAVWALLRWHVRVHSQGQLQPCYAEHLCEKGALAMLRGAGASSVDGRKADGARSMELDICRQVSVHVYLVAPLHVPAAVGRTCAHLW